MKKVSLTLLCLLSAFLVSAQTASTDYTKLAKEDLTVLKQTFTKNDSIVKAQQDTLKVMTQRLDPNMDAQRLKIVGFWKKRDTIYLNSKTSWNFYFNKKVPDSVLNDYFRLPDPYQIYENRDDAVEEKPEEVEEELVTENYLFFGDDKIVLKMDFIKDPIIKEVFNNILKDDRILNLGDFWFPKNEQEILLHEWVKDFDEDNELEDWSEESKKQKSEQGESNNEEGENATTSEDSSQEDNSQEDGTQERFKKLKFHKIELELYEGSLVDIKVYLKNDHGNVYLFENRRSISLLRFTKSSDRFFLANRSQQTFENSDHDFSDYKLRLSDVLRYFNSLGKNFIPDDQNFVFPIESKDTISNAIASNIYELQQSTALENVLDLRTYTDFLGVFGDAANGIAQFEGNATFFVNPFRAYSTSIFFFKKIRPYVSFARLDEENRYLALQDIGESVDGQRQLAKNLDNLQQSYLDMGVILDIASFKFSKEMPFETNLYGVVRYQIAELQLDETTIEDYKTLGVGAGILFDFRRFDNFSFSYRLEWARYSQDQYNNIPGITDQDPFWVFRNEAEVAYYAGGSKHNAIFVRLKNFDDFSSTEGSNFFQFQFGYRFGIGVQKVKGKN